ncbi:Sensor histidine kinase YehU [compost metagenome]
MNSEVELIHLRQEMELLRAYMYIQNYRYEGLVTVDYEVDPQLEYALVPKLSLQPLMENALKHGFAHMPEDARVVLRVFHLRIMG